VPGLLATWGLVPAGGQIGATRAAPSNFLIRVFRRRDAAVLLGEASWPRDILGVAIIAAGILAVQYRAKKGTDFDIEKTCKILTGTGSAP